MNHDGSPRMLVAENGLKESEAMPLRAKLYQKVNAIAKELGPVKADGHNAHSGYDYIGYEQVNAKLRNLLPKYNLAIVPSFGSFTENYFKDNKDRQVVRTVAYGSFLLVDLETGYAEAHSAVGADQDTQGKSGGQAITEMQKRFELKLFHISTKGDIDPDSKSVEVVDSNIDPIEFVKKDEELKGLCSTLSLKTSDIKRIVTSNNFDRARIIDTMKKMVDF